jgi:hypothetical protein
MTHRQPYIPPDQRDSYNKSSFVNEAPAAPAPAAPAAPKKPARKPAAKKAAPKRK